MKSRTRFTGGLPLLLLLLTGCGSDRPILQQPPQPHPTQAATPLTAGPTGTASADPASSGPPDPLIGDSQQAQSDPLIGRDPQLGPAMPTKHSHWLRGNLREAHVTVLLNGVRHGSFTGILDQDITMKLRQGANTITFEFQPSSTRAEGDLEIVEGEHDPPLGPLVTFHGEAGPAGSDSMPGDALKPVMKTYPFVAN